MQIIKLHALCKYVCNCSLAFWFLFIELIYTCIHFGIFWFLEFLVICCLTFNLFESLPVQNARIVIDKFQIVLHSLDSIAPVGILHPSSFHLEPKLENMAPRVGNDGTFMNRSVTDRVIEVEGNDIIDNFKDDNQLDTLQVDTETDHKRSLITSKTQNGILTIGCWLQSSLKPMQGRFLPFPHNIIFILFLLSHISYCSSKVRVF